MARHILLKNKKKQRIIQLNAGLKYNRRDDNYKRVHKDTFSTFIAIRPHNHKSYFIFDVENK